MIGRINRRGLVEVTHGGDEVPLIEESRSDCHDEGGRPGSTHLWVGERHCLNREEVAELVSRLQWWLETSYLKADGEEEEKPLLGPVADACYGRFLKD